MAAHAHACVGSSAMRVPAVRFLVCSVVASNVVFLSSGCASAPTGPVEMLDRDTGATVTSVATPFVFMRERRVESQSALARDPAEQRYVTLVPLDVNRNSRHDQLILAYLWGAGVATPVLELVA